VNREVQQHANSVSYVAGFGTLVCIGFFMFGAYEQTIIGVLATMAYIFVRAS
jgi:hypothetical protein